MKMPYAGDQPQYKRLKVESIFPSLISSLDSAINISLCPPHPETIIMGAFTMALAATTFLTVHAIPMTIIRILLHFV